MSTQIRRLWLNGLLLLIVAGLGGWVWWQQQQPAAVADKLVPLSKEAVQQITISRSLDQATPEHIRLVKQGEYWQMLAPKNGVVNPARVVQLFTLLDENVEASYDATGKNLTAYQLKPGNAALILNDQTLVFGMDNPVSHKRYVLHAGKIKLVSEAVFGLLTGEAADLLALQLAPPDHKVVQVTLPTGFANNADILFKWQEADAMRVETWDAASAPQDSAKVTLHLDNGQQLAFSVLSQTGDVVLGNAQMGVKYVLPETQRASLFVPVAAKPQP